MRLGALVAIPVGGGLAVAALGAATGGGDRVWLACQLATQSLALLGAIRVARALDPLLDDPDQRTREAAVGLLRSAGDATSVAALERFRRVEEIPDLQDAARDAIVAIQSRRKTAPPTPNEVDARMEALEKRLDELESRLDAAEKAH